MNGKLLILIGCTIAGVGIVVSYAPWLLNWFGRLPGDIRIEKEHSFIFIPITSMFILSLALSLIFFFFRR